MFFNWPHQCRRCFKFVSKPIENLLCSECDLAEKFGNMTLEERNKTIEKYKTFGNFIQKEGRGKLINYFPGENISFKN